MIRNISDRPLKVRNWNSEKKPETRIHKPLQIMEGGFWVEIEHEIDQSGNVTTGIFDVCSMP